MVIAIEQVFANHDGIQTPEGRLNSSTRRNRQDSEEDRY